MEKKNGTLQINDKQDFLTYLSSFFTGWVVKDFIEDELRVATKKEKLPSVSIRNFFNRQSRNDLGRVFRDTPLKTLAKDLGKELSIEAASIVPGAAVGYFVLAPVVNEIVFHHAPAKPPTSTITQPQHQGTLADAPALEAQK